MTIQETFSGFGFAFWLIVSATIIGALLYFVGENFEKVVGNYSERALNISEIDKETAIPLSTERLPESRTKELSTVTHSLRYIGPGLVVGAWLSTLVIYGV